MPHDDSRFSKHYAKKLNKKLGHQKAKTIALEHAQNKEDSLTSSMLKRAKAKAKGVSMSRKLLG